MITERRRRTAVRLFFETNKRASGFDGQRDTFSAVLAPRPMMLRRYYYYELVAPLVHR
jgi:hypothetical protein